MKIEDFLQLKEFNEFKIMGKKLIEINDLPQWFWDKANTPLNYNMLPDYCKLVNEYRMRYVEIEFSDDIVGMVFKVVQIIKTKQIRLFEVPFSLNNNNNNIKTVISHLSKTLNNNFIIISNQFTYGIEEKEYNNYYYNYPFYKQLETNKYRRKNQYSYYESNFKLELYTNLTDDLKKYFIQINKTWSMYKENAESSKSFIYALNRSNKNEHYLYYLGFLNDVPCVCGISIITKFGLYGIFRFSLVRTDPKYRSINIHTSKLLSKKMLEEKNILNIYNLGAIKKEKGVIKFKETTSAGKINSYRLNIEQLLEVM